MNKKTFTYHHSCPKSTGEYIMHIWTNIRLVNICTDVCSGNQQLEVTMYGNTINEILSQNDQCGMLSCIFQIIYIHNIYVLDFITFSSLLSVPLCTCYCRGHTAEESTHRVSESPIWSITLDPTLRVVADS